MMTTDNAALPRLAFITLPGPGRACCVVLDGCLVLAAEADDQPSLKSAVKRVARNLEAVVKTPARDVRIEAEDDCDLDWDELIQLLIDTQRIAGPTQRLSIPGDKQTQIDTQFYDDATGEWTDVTITLHGALTVTVDGYGDYHSESSASERPVIMAEVFDGVARCVVWADINQEEGRPGKLKILKKSAYPYDS